MTQKMNPGAPRKRRQYDATFRAEALRLASESRSTQAAARQLGISPKLLYQWQKATQPVLEVGSGEGESATMRQLRAENRRWQQARDILKKALASNCCRRRITQPNLWAATALFNNKHSATRCAGFAVCSVWGWPASIGGKNKQRFLRRRLSGNKHYVKPLSSISGVRARADYEPSCMRKDIGLGVTASVKPFVVVT